MEFLNSALYPAIFYRKSTRKYSDISISKELLDKLEAFISQVTALLPAERAAFEIQPHRGSTMKIAAYAEDTAAARTNMAFMLQQMDLFLQANGMGALWNATIRATKREINGLPYGIALIFGVTRGEHLRTDVGQFDRKQAQEISNCPELSVVEGVRLAPSARNRQPWFLSCREGQIDFYCAKGGLIDNTLLKGLQWVDIGIALCHAALMLQHEGFAPIAVRDVEAPPKEGYRHSVRLTF